MTRPLGNSSPSGLRALWSQTAALIERVVPADAIALLARIGIGGVFWQSGRTKVEGWLNVTPGAIDLFRTEYALPLLPPEMAAHAAAYAEHMLPILLVLGLGTRLAAAGLLGMTLVIQLFVYPSAWPTHATWAALLLGLLVRGGGRWSVDRRLGIA